MYEVKNVNAVSSYGWQTSGQEKQKELQGMEAEKEQKGFKDSESASIKRCFDKKKQKNLYDATADLMAIANAEKEPPLKAIYTRLLFKARILKLSGASSGEIRIALRKIKKVIGKVKTKIKKLKEEEQIEKKRRNAEKARQRKLEEELRKELTVRRKIRKEKERRDVEESRISTTDVTDGGIMSEMLPTAAEAESISEAGAACGLEAAVGSIDILL